jgi:hypothetical protein
MTAESPIVVLDGVVSPGADQRLPVTVLSGWLAGWLGSGKTTLPPWPTAEALQEDEAHDHVHLPWQHA